MSVLQRIGRAVSGFLRGFLGLGSAPHPGGELRCSHAGHDATPTPKSVRAALTARSAGRGTCC